MYTHSVGAYVIRVIFIDEQEFVEKFRNGYSDKVIDIGAIR